MTNLLLLSNGKLAGQEFLEYARPWIADHFKSSAESPRTILFVPYALKDQDVYTQKATEALSPLGIRVISAHTTDDPVALLDEVDGVFVGGGNTFRLLDRLQSTGLLAAIKAKVEAGMPYMGASAGTNIAGPTIRTTNDMPIIQPKSFDAMKFVPFQINPHYVDGKFYYPEGAQLVPYSGETRAERIAEFHEEDSTPVVGLKEGTALHVTDRGVELLGGKPARLFQQGKDSIEIADGKALSILMSRQETNKSHSG